MAPLGVCHGHSLVLNFFTLQCILLGSLQRGLSGCRPATGRRAGPTSLAGAVKRLIKVVRSEGTQRRETSFLANSIFRKMEFSAHVPCSVVKVSGDTQERGKEEYG